LSFVILPKDYMESERPIKAGQTRNTMPNLIFSLSRFQVLLRTAVCPTVASLKFLPSLQPVPNSNLPNELPLSRCGGIYFPEAFGGAAACVSIGRTTVVTSGFRTGSDEEADLEVAAGLGGWEDVRRYENGSGSMVNSAV
jgi:hypothetical protein